MIAVQKATAVLGLGRRQGLHAIGFCCSECYSFWVIILLYSWGTRFIGPIAFVLFCVLAFVFVVAHGSVACCVTMMTTYGIPC